MFIYVILQLEVFNLFQFYKTWSFMGEHNISVTAENALGSEVTMMKVKVIHAITKVRINVPTTVHKKESVISIKIHGNGAFLLRVDFGDGNSTEVSSISHEADLALERTGTNKLSPSYMIKLPHEYAEVGHYKVSANVSNAVSWLSQSEKAVVEEPIGGVIMTASIAEDEVMQIGDKVVVTVTVATGNDLQFRWDMGEGYPPTVSR